MEQDPQLEREVCHTKEGGESDVGSEVADSVCPRAIGETSLPQKAALRLKPPPTDTKSPVCKKDAY